MSFMDRNTFSPLAQPLETSTMSSSSTVDSGWFLVRSDRISNALGFVSMYFGVINMNQPVINHLCMAHRHNLEGDIRTPPQQSRYRSLHHLYSLLGCYANSLLSVGRTFGWGWVHSIGRENGREGHRRCVGISFPLLLSLLRQ